MHVRIPKNRHENYGRNAKPFAQKRVVGRNTEHQQADVSPVRQLLSLRSTTTLPAYEFARIRKPPRERSTQATFAAGTQKTFLLRIPKYSSPEAFWFFFAGSEKYPLQCLELARHDPAEAWMEALHWKRSGDWRAAPHALLRIPLAHTAELGRPQ